MSTHCKNYKCSACDYISEKKYNVTRHIVRVHNKNTLEENLPKGTENLPKGTDFLPKGTDFENEEKPASDIPVWSDQYVFQFADACAFFMKLQLAPGGFRCHGLMRFGISVLIRAKVYSLFCVSR